MYDLDLSMINAIDTIANWQQDSAVSCVAALAALRYRD